MFVGIPGMSIKSLSVVSCEDFVFLSSSLPSLCWLSFLIYIYFFVFHVNFFMCVCISVCVRALECGM